MLHIKLPWLNDVDQAKRLERLSVVFTRDEVRCPLAQLEGTVWEGTVWLVTSLTHGGGLRLLECLRPAR